MPSIYIIDDDIDLLEAVKPLLRKSGFDVTTFFEWEIANKALQILRPQMILLDVFLKGIDGIDVCKLLKNSPYTRHIPVMLFSGFPKIAETGVDEYGADDFIAKPFEVGDLVKKLYAILAKTGQTGRALLNRFL